MAMGSFNSPGSQMPLSEVARPSTNPPTAAPNTLSVPPRNTAMNPMRIGVRPIVGYATFPIRKSSAEIPTKKEPIIITSR